MKRLFINRNKQLSIGLLSGLLLVATTIYLSNKYVQKLKLEEANKVKSFASAQEILINKFSYLSENEGKFLIDFLQSNKTIPVLLVGEQGEYIDSRNIPKRIVKDKELLAEKIKTMADFRPPIVLESPGENQYIYFENSKFLKQLSFYPIAVVVVTILFIFISFWNYIIVKESEKSFLWAGLAKETAHQLGTPLSSLMGWLELLKSENVNPMIVYELGKDIERLKVIAERFSKIGSKSVLVKTDIVEHTKQTLEYLKSRVSSKVNFMFNSSEEKVFVNLNILLFSWVIENLVKNSIDAMNNKGDITIEISEQNKSVVLSFKDTGMGIASAKQKKVFTPGFTSKKRGWGLGLSLSRRIIEEYHYGLIFVESSHLGKGTVMKIVLDKA